MIKHAALATVVATAELLYTALTHEPDLAEFDRKELESLIESQRLALLVTASIEDRRQQFALLIMDYAEQENERLRASHSGYTLRNNLSLFAISLCDCVQCCRSPKYF